MAPIISTNLEVEICLRLLLALILGAVVGIERKYHDHPAGMRTMGMVAMGSCLFTVVGSMLFATPTDPTRIAAQVASGVGFLGAGTILRNEGKVNGLTTAATIWIVAAIGMAAGFGLFILAAFTTLAALVALVAMRPLEEKLFSRSSRLRPKPKEDP